MILANAFRLQNSFFTAIILIEGILLNRNKLYIYNRALTLLEVMIGLLIFTILFLAAASAFAPSGTTHHSLLRDSTQVMRLANYFLNDVEKKIAYSGDLDAGLLGEHDMTAYFLQERFKEAPLIRSLKAESKITDRDGAYAVRLTIKWDDKPNVARPRHHITLERLIAKPGI